MLSFESPVITPWHKVPVVVKFLAVCVVSVLLYVYGALEVQLFALMVVTALYAVCGERFFKAGFARLKFLWPMLLIILVWHGFTGTLMQGVAIALRICAVIALSNLMTMTSKLSDLIDMLNKGLAPLRKLGISTRPLEIAVALVMRFTPVLIGKGGALVDAWKLRSVKKPSYRIIFPLSLAAIDDAESVAEALKARGGVSARPNN